MRFLVDMNLSPRWVNFLAAAGHEADHWIDVGEPNAPDRTILDHAHRNRLVILTQDLDFGTLLAVGGLSTPSVIQFRAQAVLPSDVGEQLLAAIDVASAHLETGALVTVDPVGHRVTVLPISTDGA
jgi:predicted nuclease of predicted toxin-antitoxin system